MIAPFAWTSFLCPACNARLDTTKVSQTIIILVVGVVRATIAWLLEAVGLGGTTSISVGAVSLFAGTPFALAVFARLVVHPAERPSVLS